ncbi:uncharacterized protein IWZ02DRAFT_490755 [Phyllosticta citriasiana]|uniref:Uncharacterized protein n=1 Tax=Phyllosticta citriasiana TaxID=595635 RepID=A0ABR1L1V1_9PEZI
MRSINTIIALLALGAISYSAPTEPAGNAVATPGSQPPVPADAVEPRWVKYGRPPNDSSRHAGLVTANANVNARDAPAPPPSPPKQPGLVNADADVNVARDAPAPPPSKQPVGLINADANVNVARDAPPQPEGQAPPPEKKAPQALRA